MKQESARHHTGVLLAACLGFVVVLMDVSIVNVALDALRTAFAARITGLQWVVNAYALVFAASLLMAGALGDKLGIKRVFVVGYALFTVTSIGCASAQSLEALIGWRLLQGVGAALLVPNSLAILQRTFHDPAVRSRAIGWWGAGGGIALAAGPVLGGLLVSALGWRSIFWVNVPVGLIGLWATWRFVPDFEASDVGRGFDLPGQVSGALSVAALSYALTEASARGWADPWIWGALVLGIASALLFWRVEAGNPGAMLPPALLGNRLVRSITLIGAVLNLVFYGVVFTLSLLFQSIWHMSPVQTGLAFLPMMGILMAMNVLAGRLMHRLGARALAAAGLLISAAGYLAMMPALAAQSLWMLALPMLLGGAGVALTIPTITHALLHAAGSGRSGIASGLLSASRQIGGVVGVALFGFLVRHSEAALFVRGLEYALLVSVALLLIAAAVAYRQLGGRHLETGAAPVAGAANSH